MRLRLVFPLAVAVLVAGCSPSPGTDDPELLRGTSWVALQVLIDGAEVPLNAGNRPSLEFSADLTQVSGHTGCNSWNGRSVIGVGTVEFDEIIQTLMACPDLLLRQESGFLDLVARAESFVVEETLIIGDGFGNSAVFGAGEPASIPVITDQEWELEAIQLGEAEPLVRSEFPADLTLRSAERNAVGSTGCNDYEIEFSATPDNRLVFGEGIISAVGCEPDAIMFQEAALLSVLSGEVRMVLNGPQLTITSSNGHTAVFRRSG